MRRPDGSPGADRLVDAAAEAFEDGRFDDALARADEAVGREPRSVPALHYRAAALAELGRTDEAVEAYEKALSAGKGDLELLLGAADFHVKASRAAVYAGRSARGGESDPSTEAAAPSPELAEDEPDAPLV